MNTQIEFYLNKLAFEIDASDLFEAMKKDEEIIIVDARKTFAFDNEHIPKAINIPHIEINEKTTAHLDKKNLYIVYCDGIGCNASTKGALNMSKLGFRVKELIGGIEWWKFDGYATEGEKGQKDKNTQCAC